MEPQPVVSSNRTARSLRAKTKQWLRNPLKSWTPKDASQGRYLMESWTTLEGPATERALNQSRIFRRWVEELKTGNLVVRRLSEDMVEMLHRCLDSCRQVEAANGQAASGAMDLLCLLDDATISTKNETIRPGNKAYSMCLNVLANNPNHPTICNDVVNLLHRRHRNKVKPDLQFYNACLHVFAKCSPNNQDAPGRAEALFREMSTTLLPNSASFVSIMHAWANSKLADSAPRAQAILDKMVESHNGILTPACFNVCIDGWAKSNEPEKAEKLLWRMNRLYQEGLSHLRPNEVSFNSAINAWAKSRHPQAAKNAEALLGKMEQFGCKPTPESYTAVLDAWSQTSRPGPKVESLLDRLEEMHLQGENIPPPSKVSYIIAIRSWARTKEFDAPHNAEKLVARMEECSGHGRPDLKPCVVVYSALIDAWSRSGRDNAPERAISILHKMQDLAASGRKEVTPNTITLNSVLDAFARQGRAEESLSLLRSIEDSYSDAHGGILPDSQSYSAVLKAYSKSRTIDAAEQADALLRELEEQHHSGDGSLGPTLTGYTYTILAWGNSSTHDAAEQAETILWNLLDRSQEENHLKPNVVAVNCVLRAWSKSREGGAAERAECLFQWLEEKGPALGIKPDAMSYLHMMFAWSHSGRRFAHNKAEDYFSRLKIEYPSEGGVLGPVTAHYNALILALAKSRSREGLKRIEGLVGEMLRLSKAGHDVAPDARTLNSSIKAFVASNAPDRLKRAQNLATKIHSSGVEPNAQTKVLLRRLS